MLPTAFYDRPASLVAKELIGKVIRRRYRELWLAAAIVETEAYGADPGNHAWHRRSKAREAMWAPPGTIYMYLSRGGDSLNVSVQGEGHVVLIKAARPWVDQQSGAEAFMKMHRLNPGSKGRRKDHKLLSGQALLARALDLRLADWNGKPFDPTSFFIEDVNYRPESIVRCRRLGLPSHWAPDLMLRYVDETHIRSATQNPLGKRIWREGPDYQRLSWEDAP